MRKVDSLIANALGREEVLRIVQARLAFREWSEVVGEFLAERSHPDRYERGTIWVAVEGSAWAQELRMIRDTILERLRARSGRSDLFQDIRFGVRPLPPKSPEGHTLAVIELPEDHRSIREIAEERLAHWPDEKGD